MIKLSEWASNQGIHYITAWNWFKFGKLPVKAIKTPSGSIFVCEDSNQNIHNEQQNIVVYCRVSNQSRKSELEYQVNRCVEYANAKGLQVTKVYKEVASGMNDNRKEFWKMIDSKPTMIIIENKDRLTRFGFTYLERLLLRDGCSINVMNPNKNDEEDLIKDLVSIITSFCCRLYGLRRSKKKVDKIKGILNDQKL